VAMPDTTLPVWVATHISLSADAEPGCPNCPDQVPVRSNGADGAADELPHAVSVANRPAATNLDTNLPVRTNGRHIPAAGVTNLSAAVESDGARSGNPPRDAVPIDDATVAMSVRLVFWFAFGRCSRLKGPCIRGVDGFHP